jgi:Peptidase A4 family
MSPNTRGSRRKRLNLRRPRLLARRHLGWLVVLGASVPVLATGYGLASPGTRSAVPAAMALAADGRDVLAGATSLATPVGGWGEGGYSMAAANVASANVASANWAGYAATGPAGSFTSVSSSWAQPGVNCGAANTFSSFWVGLDGAGTPTVEQTGTEADCANGAARYRGWYEFFPNAPVFFADRVQPGDTISASVVVGAAGTFTLTVSDANQGWTQTIQQAEADARLGSAEVIAEAPSNGTVLPLADFGTVNFTAATVDHAPIGASAKLRELTMQSTQGATLATPSVLSGGNAFSVTVDNPAGPGSGAVAADQAGLVTAGGGGGASDGGGRRHHHHDLGF